MLKDQPNLNEILLSWKSPSHPFKKRAGIYYQTLAALTLLLIIITYFLFHDLMMILVIVSTVFVVVAVSKVVPVEVEHKITRIGFENAGRLFRWVELYAFWFEEKWGYKTLVVHTRLPFPAQIRAVLGETKEEQLKEIVGKYLLFMEKPPKSWADNFSDWLTQKIPLETTS